MSKYSYLFMYMYIYIILDIDVIWQESKLRMLTSIIQKTLKHVRSSWLLGLFQIGSCPTRNGSHNISQLHCM